MQINGLNRPNDLKSIDLTLTSQQGKLLKCLMDDARSIKDNEERFLSMKYWFLRAWETAETEGKENRELVNQWRKKKKEILTKKTKVFCEKEGGISSPKFAYCPLCKKQIAPLVGEEKGEYGCPSCFQDFNDKDHEIRWLDW